jgi:hypothetical protein
MTSSTKQQTVPELRTTIHVPTVPGALTTRSAVEHFREYGRERPGVLALWCLGIGFVLGWKLKLW